MWVLNATPPHSPSLSAPVTFLPALPLPRSHGDRLLSLPRWKPILTIISKSGGGRGCFPKWNIKEVLQCDLANSLPRDDGTPAKHSETNGPPSRASDFPDILFFLPSSLSCFYLEAAKENN